MPSSIPPVTVRFSEKTRDNLAQFAKLTNRSRSYVINQAVEAFLATRMAYLDDLSAAVDSIETHPTYAAEDVFDWMHTWGTDDEKPFDQTKAIPPKRSS